MNTMNSPMRRVPIAFIVGLCACSYVNSHKLTAKELELMAIIGFDKTVVLIAKNNSLSMTRLIGPKDDGTEYPAIWSRLRLC